MCHFLIGWDGLYKSLPFICSFSSKEQTQVIQYISTMEIHAYKSVYPETRSWFQISNQKPRPRVIKQFICSLSIPLSNPPSPIPLLPWSPVEPTLPTAPRYHLQFFRTKSLHLVLSGWGKATLFHQLSRYIYS